MSFPEELLKVLLCPACKNDLTLAQGRWLVCQRCQRRYPIREDGIAVLLISEGDHEGVASSAIA
ncbi:MAG: Trm112 family protein [Candidatus Bipolaricaulota bacterium]|nr:Trm112 family protein [Candidatus Bipolaricaulota bacterium]MDW8031872.1 Trm112 family protein [Candidatus Bipolaricaulota bacterium]